MQPKKDVQLPIMKANILVSSSTLRSRPVRQISWRIRGRPIEAGKEAWSAAAANAVQEEHGEPVADDHEDPEEGEGEVAGQHVEAAVEEPDP